MKSEHDRKTAQTSDPKAKGKPAAGQKELTDDQMSGISGGLGMDTFNASQPPDTTTSGPGDGLA